MTGKVLSDYYFTDLDRFIDELPDKEGSLIAVLHKAQVLFGYLPKEVQLHISHKLDTPAATVNGVVSFYSYFTETPRGEHTINVCMGTACFVRGAEEILTTIEDHLHIKAGETTADGKFSLDALRCIGACGLAPIILVDDKVYGRVDKDEVNRILRSLEQE